MTRHESDPTILQPRVNAANPTTDPAYASTPLEDHTLSTEPTDEMVRAAEIAYGGNVEGDLIGALKAALAIADREHAAEVTKLRGAFEVASTSRSMWRQRAMDAGWIPAGAGAVPVTAFPVAADHRSRLAGENTQEA